MCCYTSLQHFSLQGKKDKGTWLTISALLARMRWLEHKFFEFLLYFIDYKLTNVNCNFNLKHRAQVVMTLFMV